jgi:hypothetical protein
VCNAASAAAEPWSSPGQRIHVCIGHAGCTLVVEAADTTFRIYDRDQILTKETRTTGNQITRFKVRKPSPLRGPQR